MTGSFPGTRGPAPKRSPATLRRPSYVGGRYAVASSRIQALQQSETEDQSGWTLASGAIIVGPLRATAHAHDSGRYSGFLESEQET